MSKPLDLLEEFGDEYGGEPIAGVFWPNRRALVVIPPNFWEGEWSTVALAIYFRLLADEYGKGLKHLYHAHPNVPQNEIINAVDALERHGFIEKTMMQPGMPGYTIPEAHIRGVEHISCYEDEEGGTE